MISDADMSKIRARCVGPDDDNDVLDEWGEMYFELRALRKVADAAKELLKFKPNTELAVKAYFDLMTSLENAEQFYP